MQNGQKQIDTYHSNIPSLGQNRKRIWSYVSLLFSLFYFAPIIFGEPSNSSLFVCVLFYLLFLPAYVFVVESKSTFRIPALALLLLVVSSALHFTIGAMVLFGYCLFPIGYYWRWQISGVLCILVSIWIVLIALWLQGPVWVGILPFLFSGIGLYFFGLMERRETIRNIQLYRSQQSVKQLSAIAERERIGRDLHDIAGHALSSISLKAQLASKLLDKDRPQQAKQEIDQLASLSQSLLAEIRNAVSNIKALSLLDEVNKIEALLFDNNISLQKDIAPNVLSQLSASNEANLTLVIKEALINVLRHSNASTVVLSGVETAPCFITVKIKDNGTATKTKTIKEGNGIQGMRERISAMKGDFSVKREDGFLIEFRIQTTHD